MSAPSTRRRSMTCVVLHSHPVLTDGPHRQLGLGRDTELSHHDHVEGCPSRRATSAATGTPPRGSPSTTTSSPPRPAALHQSARRRPASTDRGTSLRSVRDICGLRQVPGWPRAVRPTAKTRGIHVARPALEQPSAGHDGADLRHPLSHNIEWHASFRCSTRWPRCRRRTRATCGHLGTRARLRSAAHKDIDAEQLTTFGALRKADTAGRGGE